ncbi:MAG: hypothetical protein ACI3XG_11475 [Faecousia sp.]
MVFQLYLGFLYFTQYGGTEDGMELLIFREQRIAGHRLGNGRILGIACERVE